MSDRIQIRMATPADAAALRAIYAPYVRRTAITFEYALPTEQEFGGRIQNTLTRYPYLVAQRDGVPLGYAYAGRFNGRQAYDWAVETSIYLAMEARGKGLGRTLYDALEEILGAQGVLNCNACIATCQGEDRHLPVGSVPFHQRMGYHLVGRFAKCGYKFGTWYDMIWMEKHLAAHPALPQRFIPLEEMEAQWWGYERTIDLEQG